MNNVRTLPGAFPLHEDKEFLSESEWVIFKLLCRPIESIADMPADELSQATGGQVSEERCDQLIRIVRIQRLPGLGSWIARIFAEAGLDDADLCSRPVAEIADLINNKMGYPLLGDATTRALTALQLQWQESKAG